MFNLEHCRGRAGSSQRGKTTACPNGTGVRRGGHGLPVSQVARQGVLGCLRPAAASDLMQKALRSCFDWQIAGPKTTNRKVLDPTAADRRCEQQRRIKAGLGH
jgi:hypothetical protein